MSHFNGLTPAEDERLALLIEECAEVIQAAAKIQRHGYESCHPEKRDWTNREELAKELGHLTHAVDRLTEASDVYATWVESERIQKARAVSQYLHHQ